MYGAYRRAVHGTSYRDIVGVWTICWGETKHIVPGMRPTLVECDAMIQRRVVADYLIPPEQEDANKGSTE